MKKLFSIRYSDNGISFAALILRLAVGGLLITHGYGKLISFSSRSSSFADPFHIGSTTTMALVIFAEFFCGVFIALGLFTRLACIPPMVSFGVIVFMLNHGKVTGSSETPALFLAGIIAILFTGPGKISVDKLIGK